MKRKVLKATGMILIAMAVFSTDLSFHSMALTVQAAAEEEEDTWIVDDDSSWNSIDAGAEDTEETMAENSLESAQIFQETETQTADSAADEDWSVDEEIEESDGSADEETEESDGSFSTGIEEHLVLYEVLLAAFFILGSGFGIAAYKMKKAEQKELW